jgi:hypothetical protein
LMNLFGEEAKGSYCMEYPPNCIWWVGMSEKMIDAIELCQKRKSIEPGYAHYLVYLIDGGMLKFPIAKRLPKGGYKKPHWVPVVFNPLEGANNHD